VGVDGSTLELYRALLAIRGERGLGVGSLGWLDGFPQEVLAFVNAPAEGGRILVITNFGADPAVIPEGFQLLVSSGPLGGGGMVPTDTTVWLID
jgi:alpha-glucosidase